MVKVPLIIRGEIKEDYSEEYMLKGEGSVISAPDLTQSIDKIHLARPSLLEDLYTLSFEDVLDYIEKLGKSLSISGNKYLQEAFEASIDTSALPESILRHQYEILPQLFERKSVHEMADRLIGIPYLEGWVEQKKSNLNDVEVRIRAFGARSVHIIAGNSPLIAAMTIVRNTITRSDAIIKCPSNDPLTAVAIVKTMLEIAPDHPITRHIVVAYWKGGDRNVESILYNPRYIEKIIAWGGLSSIQHITGYLRPGIDLITLNPKLSTTIIKFDNSISEVELNEIACRLALDIGVMNQEGCFNARVIYVICGTDSQGLFMANKLGEKTFHALQELPPALSTSTKYIDPELKAHLEGLKFIDNEYKIYTEKGDGAAIIVSQHDNPVDFSHILGGRVANIVPVDEIEVAVLSVNSYAQTIGIYPESLKTELRDRLAFQGGQRFVSLGMAAFPQSATPQDGMEPLRRMCNWVVEETGEVNVPELYGSSPDFPDRTGSAYLSDGDG